MEEKEENSDSNEDGIDKNYSQQTRLLIMGEKKGSNWQKRAW